MPRACSKSNARPARASATIGMADIADDEPTAPRFWKIAPRTAASTSRLSATAPRPAFSSGRRRTGRAYIEEVSVHPEHAGRRLAARLIDALASDVRGTVSLRSRWPRFATSLGTRRTMRSLGFAELPRGQAGPNTNESWQHQAEDGLDMSRRLFMIRPVAAT